MEQRSPWQLDLAREPAVRRLVRALSLSRRFHFYIVTCKAPVVTDEVLSVVEREAAEGQRPSPFRRIDPYAAHDDFTIPIDAATLVLHVMEELMLRGEPDLPARTCLDATFAFAADEPAWNRLFRKMNERRNSVVKSLPGELLLCLPPRLEDTFKAAAPDFWSIRSGEYEVMALPPGRAVEAEPPHDLARRIYQSMAGDRPMDAVRLALAEGNAALRKRDARFALWCFRRMQDAVALLLVQDAWRSEHVEMAERAALGVSRARLLQGDVAGAEEAEQAARSAVSRSAGPQVPVGPPPLDHPPYRIFVSYAPEDRGLVNELERHLAPLERSGVITVWHQGKVRPGEAWDRAISHELQQADIVLLLLSAHFLASERAVLEIERALRLADERGTLVIPVRLKASLLLPNLENRQSLPDGPPVSAWENRDEAWYSVVSGVEKALARLPFRSR